ncbi:MAG TPA: UDP-N-acetylmuramoyl-L-alanine--D-glutamate ligase [Candidatus Paceibacterota bacterium]|nr:UDP-N-acetylmuramoyl-L-alanine--D-glutamate ligase [Candidatus Paceibacterota bacterium]
MLIAELKDKEILILGFGREGQDSFLFLRTKFPQKSIGIADQKEFDQLAPETQKLLNRDRKVVLYMGDSYLAQVNKYDVVIKSPGIPRGLVLPLVKKSQVLCSQTSLFFDNCPGTIVGITGTKGKSTTASLIYEVLKQGKIKAHLIGNIEQPVFQFLEAATKDDVYVYELSSFQLEGLQKSPHIAVFLNLYPEHLDHHGDFKTYVQAKASIAKFQTPEDYFIFNETDPEVSRIAKLTKAAKIPFTPTRENGASFVAATEPVFLVAELFDISKEKAQKAIAVFKPLAHRLELVGEKRGITFYNDSLATIPEATIAALDALGENVATLIAGGFDRGVPMGKLAQRIAESNIKTLVLFPTTGEKLWKEIEKAQPNGELPKHFFANTMADAVEICYRETPKGKICLLSPAASSFNMFRDYKERGEEFKKFVKLYATKKLS